MRTVNEYQPEKSANIKLTAYISLISILLGALIFAVSKNFANELITTRMLYGVPCIVALLVIASQVWIWRWIGLLSPLTWCMVGFLFFLCLTPIVSPTYFSAYRDLYWVSQLVSTILIGMISYTLGFFLRPKMPLKGLHVWFEKPISPSRLANLVLLTMAAYLLLALYLARAGGYSISQFLTLSLYVFGGQQGLANTFGEYYYIIFIYQLLPVAIAVPAAYCVSNKEIPYIKRALMLLGMGVMILAIFAAGGRGVVAFALGGMGVYYVSGFLIGKANHIPIARVVMSAMFMGAVLIGIAVVQIGIRQKRVVSGIDSGQLDLGQAVQGNFISESTDQNFTLYQVLRQEQAGTLNYLRGESYFLSFVAMIPRSIWPEKPGGADMYTKLALIDPWHANVNISHSALGELIYNFSYPSIIPGMILFGCVAGMVWRVFLQHKHAYKARILYSMTVIPVAFMVRGTFHATFGGILYPFLLTVLLLSIANKRFQPATSLQFTQNSRV